MCAIDVAQWDFMNLTYDVTHGTGCDWTGYVGLWEEDGCLGVRWLTHGIDCDWVGGVGPWEEDIDRETLHYMSCLYECRGWIGSGRDRARLDG